MADLIDEKKLADMTGRKRSAWQKDRHQRNPNSIPFIKCGRLVRYRLEEVEAWLQRQTVNPAAPKDGGEL